MRRTVLIALVTLFSFGCTNGFFNKTLESRVVVDAKEYKVFYTVKREQGEIDWEGKRFGIVKYKIRDEATRNSEFYIHVEYDSHYPSSIKFVAYPMYFSQVENNSFLQEIVLKNDRSEGQEIFRNIFNQLEQSKNR